ncbi:hypothetical protein CTI12_AA237490 [Artemisia annua]|uniref:Heat shock protein 70 family n=1 Tax=Artemisia annua TaxID=35608 RepID=A0A2U1NRU2_ARTAN|nr:hypothetical protein CTI12_AA237490 [Artemisia annua]
MLQCTLVWYSGCISAISIAKDEEIKLGTVIGIDFGTTYSCIGVYKNGHVEIIANDQGNCITPSWVAFTDSEWLIGEAAKDQAAVNAKRTIFNVKRLIGRKREAVYPSQLNDCQTKFFSPEAITAMILTKMKPTDEAYLGHEIKYAVIKVRDIRLLDVASVTLGIEIVGGVLTELIPKNTMIPTKRSQVYSIYRGDQTVFSIKVLFLLNWDNAVGPLHPELEPIEALHFCNRFTKVKACHPKDCRLLGTFDLCGFPLANTSQIAKK